jgi:hypothetical protein
MSEGGSRWADVSCVQRRVDKYERSLVDERSGVTNPAEWPAGTKTMCEQFAEYRISLDVESRGNSMLCELSSP